MNLSALAGRLFLLARVGWPIYVTLLMTIFIAGVQVRYIQLTDLAPEVRASLESLGMSIASYASYNLGLEIVFALVFLGVAALIYARNSDDWMGLMSAYALATFGTAAAPITVTMESLVGVAPEWALPVRLLRFTGWALMVLFFYLFPDGKFVHPRLRPLVLMTIVLLEIPWNLFPDQPFSPWQWPAPYQVAVILGTWGPAVLVQIYRYSRISNRVRKQQTKWFVYGSTLAVAGAVGLFLPRVIDPTLNDVSRPESLQYQLFTSAIIYLSVMLLPVAIGISILRYRLWDIDILINKTLVYVPLTGILAGVYAASVKIFQTFFETLLGTKGEMSVVMTTLLLVATFTPVKDALQRLVDRRFKSPPNPAEELRVLLRDMRLYVEMNQPEQITRRVLGDLVRAFRAEGGAVYLARGDTLELMREAGDWNEAEEELSAPMVCQGEKYGEIKLSGRRGGEEYNARDIKLLRDTASLLACTLRVEEHERSREEQAV
jgi:hypothetical protein